MLENIEKAIQETVELEKDKILSHAKAEVEKINKQTEKRIEKLEGTFRQQIDQELSEFKKMSFAQLEQEERGIDVQFHKNCQEKIYNIIKQRLIEYKKQDAYKKTLKNYCHEILQEYSKNKHLDANMNFTIRIVPEDQNIVEEVLQEISNETSLQWKIKADGDFLGGLEAESLQGKITIKNTFLSRLQALEKVILEKIACIIT